MRIGNSAVRVFCTALLCTSSALASAQINLGGSASSSAAGGIGPSLPIPDVLNADGSIPDQYIVTLNTSALSPALKLLGLEQQIKAILAPIGGGEVLATYDTVMTGFAVRIPAAKLGLLKALPQIAAVEPDYVGKASAVQDNPPNWGLDRIDQRNLPLDSKYGNPDWQGQGAHIYIFDSGINPNHQEFAGRISPIAAAPHNIWVRAVASDPWDCNGHGTFVAGIAAGTLTGVAKKATLHSVRVLDCNKYGSYSGIIAAMDWVAKNAIQPAVANMSLGGPKSTALNNAARALVNANVAVAVAAGNENRSACNVSPASEPSVLTVGGTSKDDSRGYYSNGGGYYSNYGSCLDLFAPGTDIVGPSHTDNTGGVMGTGTSAASPFVAGALAIWRAKWPTYFTAKQQQDGLAIGNSTNNRVINAGAGSPNRLLYIDQAPKAAFEASCNSRNCAFDARSSTDERAIPSYEWNFGDGTTGTGANVAHTYARAGIYSVTLTLTDDTTQTGTTTRLVTVIGL